MGMYTEIYVKAEFPGNTDPIVIKVLRHMMDEDVGLDESEIPCHPLFKTSRWEFMLRCCSFYHVPFRTGEFKQEGICGDWYLVNRSDFKNYEGEAELFFDWIKTYISKNGSEPTFMGYTLYEEDWEPKFYYA
jgi:hypothetical protein